MVGPLLWIFTSARRPLVIHVGMLYMLAQLGELPKHGAKHVDTDLETGNVLSDLLYIVSLIKDYDRVLVIYLEVVSDLRVDQIVIGHQDKISKLDPVLLQEIGAHFMLPAQSMEVLDVLSLCPRETIWRETILDALIILAAARIPTLGLSSFLTLCGQGHPLEVLIRWVYTKLIS